MGKNRTSYGFNQDTLKETDEETLKKYFKGLDRNTFFFEQIDHIPVDVKKIQ